MVCVCGGGGGGESLTVFFGPGTLTFYIGFGLSDSLLFD